MLSCVKHIADRSHFPADIFKRIFWNENVRISINISLTLVSLGSY